MTSPAVPGMTFLAGAVAEVAVLAVQGGQTVHDAVPFWVQIVPVGIIFAIGAWGMLRLLALERDTAIRFREMEQQIERRDDERHKENQGAIAQLARGQEEMKFLLMGIQGKGGLLEDREKNQERRHELAQEITIIYGILREQAIVLTKVCELVKVQYAPEPIDRPRRRRGDDRD